MAFELGGGVAINDRNPDKPPHGVLSLNVPKDLSYASWIGERFLGKVAPYKDVKSAQIRWGSQRALVLALLMIPFAPSRRADLTTLLNKINPDCGFFPEPLPYEEIVKRPAALASIVENKISLDSVVHRNTGFSSSKLDLLTCLNAEYGGDIRKVAEAGTKFRINQSEITCRDDLWRWQLSGQEDIRRFLEVAKKGAFFKTEQIERTLAGLVA
jgi:hypothetical protein